MYKELYARSVVCISFMTTEKHPKY